MTVPRATSCALIALVLLSCTGRKQVPFGLEDADEESPGSGATGGSGGTAPPLLASGEAFEAGQVEVPVEAATLVLDAGYALGALRLDLDRDETLDALVVSASAEQVRLIAAYSRGQTVESRSIDSFLVPRDCLEATAVLVQLSQSLVGATIRHACPEGTRENLWIVSLETQPRVRERITVLPPDASSPDAIEVTLGVEDRDSDGYDDVIAQTRVGSVQVPLAWLDRPGGFARDVSQPENTLQELATQAADLLATKPSEAEALASGVVAAFRALCRESGNARLGVSGIEGLQCLSSPATALAVGVGAAAAIGRGDIIRALELSRCWEQPSTRPTAADRALVDAAWAAANAKSKAEWKKVDAEASPVQLRFENAETLWVGGSPARTIELASGVRRTVPSSLPASPIVDPEGRFQVIGVRVTCAGFEAEISPVRGRQSHRVLIERRPQASPCKTPIDRPSSPLEWGVLGWAPQGLVVARDDRLRIVPLNSLAKPAGAPFDLKSGAPLPAPIRGARITPDGERYVLPQTQGVLVRDTRGQGRAVWLRPPDWDQVPGAVGSTAISPDGKQVALQKGNEIRVLTW